MKHRGLLCLWLESRPKFSLGLFFFFGGFFFYNDISCSIRPVPNNSELVSKVRLWLLCKTRPKTKRPSKLLIVEVWRQNPSGPSQKQRARQFVTYNAKAGEYHDLENSCGITTVTCIALLFPLRYA